MTQRGILSDRKVLRSEVLVENIRRNPLSLLKCHREGLTRATKVAQNIPDYSAVLAGKISSRHLAIFDGDLDFVKKVDAAALENSSALLSGYANVARFTNSGIACFGSTKNNIREFEFFEKLCEHNSVKILDNNVAKYQRNKVRLSQSLPKEFISKIVDDVTEFYQSLGHINSSIFYQQYLYTRSYASYCASLLDASAVLPSMLVLANDHMPVHIAISMAMKSVGVPRLYLQHAEVSEAFPPLDFEFNLLRSQKSLDTYRAIGEIEGKVYIVPRDSTPVPVERLREGAEEQSDVVIYPTARVIAEEFKRIVVLLRQNPAVLKLSVKPHPSSSPPLEDVLSGFDVEFVHSIPTTKHVAVVGNSSIAIELLQLGVPVYQNFDFDPVPRDYYCLVRDRLTQETASNQLKQKFWGRYPVSPEWINQYKLRLPVADETTLADAKSFVAEVTKYRVDDSIARGSNLAGSPQAESRVKQSVSAWFLWFANRLRRNND